MKLIMIMMVTMFAMCTPVTAGFEGIDDVTSLGIFNKIKCSSGMTCSRTGDGLFTLGAPGDPFTFTNGEIMNNTVDDTIDILSDDTHTTLKITGFEASDAILEFAADQEDDTADLFTLKADASNVFTLMNGVTDLNTVSSAGAWTFISTIGLLSGELIDNAVDDTINFASPDATTTLKITGFEASDAILEFAADEEDDTADLFSFKADAANLFTFSNGVTALNTITSAGAWTFIGSVTGDGGDAMSGFLQSQVASTTASLTAAQCGSTIISDSADVQVLPEASTVLGCQYTFVCGTTDDYDIDPADGTDTILPYNYAAGSAAVSIAPAAGDAIRCTDIGVSLVMEAISANGWAVIGTANGVWADVN